MRLPPASVTSNFRGHKGVKKSENMLWPLRSSATKASCQIEVAAAGAVRERGSGRRPIVPVEDTQRPQRVPPAGPAVAFLERKVHLSWMRVLQ